MTIEIIINIDTHELKKLEANNSALVAFILANFARHLHIFLVKKFCKMRENCENTK